MFTFDPQFKYVDAAMTVKDQVHDALKNKWPEEIADYVNGLIQQAPNILYVAQSAHDYFVPPDYKLTMNWWIEMFSPKNEGRMAMLATTDKGLFDLLLKHGKVNKTAHDRGMLLIGFTEIIAAGGKGKDGRQRKYVSVNTISAMYHTQWPLTSCLTRLVHAGTINPEHVAGMEKYGRILWQVFNTAYYHMSHNWPVWVGTQPHSTGPIAVFGINPNLGAAASPTALLQALNQSTNEPQS